MAIVIGIGSILEISSRNTLIQTIVDDAQHRRVISFFTLALLGIFPFGNLLAGVLAERVGATNTLILGGVFRIICSLVFISYLPRIMHSFQSTHQKNGILPRDN